MSCPRIVCETWTPGRTDLPSGPSREMHTPCVLEEAGHEGPHTWGTPEERR